MSKTTPEGRVKDSVKAVILSVRGVYAFWPVQSGRGKTTLDCLGIRPFDGKAFAVETKRPGKRHDMTEQQKKTGREIVAAGGVLFVIDDEEGDDLRRFSTWLNGSDEGVLDINIRVYMLIRPEDSAPAASPEPEASEVYAAPRPARGAGRAGPPRRAPSLAPPRSPAKAAAPMPPPKVPAKGAARAAVRGRA
jgi:hypothetical protein